MKMRYLTAVVGSLCAVATPAAADQVGMMYVGAGQGRDVRMSVGSLTMDVFAGQLKHQISGGTGAASGLNGVYTTFCADAAEYLKYAETPYSVAAIADLPKSSGWAPMGAEREQGVYDLYAAASGSQLGASSDADLAAAFQVALWEVIYDFNGTRSSMDATSGIMSVSQTSGAALTGSMLSYLNGFFDAIMLVTAQQSGLIGLSNWGGQDQIVSPVMIPLPNPALLGLAGMAGLGALAMIRRRSK